MSSMCHKLNKAFKFQNIYYDWPQHWILYNTAYIGWLLLLSLYITLGMMLNVNNHHNLLLRLIWIGIAINLNTYLVNILFLLLFYFYFIIIIVRFLFNIFPHSLSKPSNTTVRSGSFYSLYPWKTELFNNLH